MGLLNNIYKRLPLFVQNGLISIFNIKAYKQRYGGEYKSYREKFKRERELSFDQLVEEQSNRYFQFLTYCYTNSSYYKKELEKIEGWNDIVNIHKLPILNKEVIRQELKNIQTIPAKSGIVSKTGGTTGKSLEIVFSHEDMQERFAMLDDFRSKAGYELGKKTAWFSGKDIITDKDVKNKRFWKTDYLHKVRYYSTFYISESYLDYYLQNIINYRPEYLIGFPSSILEIVKHGRKKGVVFPEGIVKAIFPTAETVTPAIREDLESFFNTKVYNQYASSEGAPLIYECIKGNLHIDIRSGVFEVLDEDDQPTNNGRMVVTSFTTTGVPLIRYDIGDVLELSDVVCNCGNNNPLAKAIHGRVDDYVYSPTRGKINLGNISNALKDTYGIRRFQVVQDKLTDVVINIQIDKTVYNDKVEKVFLQNLKDRLGSEMGISLNFMNEIPVEKSGKFRLVKNNVKHLCS